MIEEDIKYEFELEENISVEDIRAAHTDGICIWVSGSGPSSSEEAKYRIVMEAKGRTKYMEKSCPGKTANQVMITGIKDAVECVLRPMRIYVISASALGFEKGLRGKGTNASYFQELFDAVIQKKCQLTEVRWNNGSNDIKKFIYDQNPDREAVKVLENKQLRYKEFIYRECLEQVTKILKEQHVSDEVIRMVIEVHIVTYQQRQSR